MCLWAQLLGRLGSVVAIHHGVRVCPMRGRVRSPAELFGDLLTGPKKKPGLPREKAPVFDSRAGHDNGLTPPGCARSPPLWTEFVSNPPLSLP